jgi:hypothetical protein
MKGDLINVSLIETNIPWHPLFRDHSRESHYKEATGATPYLHSARTSVLWNMHRHVGPLRFVF